MKTIEMAEATAPLSQYAQEVDHGSLILTIEGRPVAALVSVENADLETMALSTHPEFIELVQRSRKRQKAEGGVPSAEMRGRLGL